LILLYRQSSTAKPEPTRINLYLSTNQTIAIQGGSLQAEVNVISVGKPENVTLGSIAGSSGIRCTFEPSLGTSNFTSLLTVNVPASISLGNYSLIVTASGGGTVENTSIAVVALAPLTSLLRPNGNLIASNLNVGEGTYGQGWNWTISFDLENTGNTAITINNMLINGQVYSSINPAPLITPSIKNGFTLSPDQTVTMSILVVNQPKALYQGTNDLYLITTMGNSLRIYLGS
jgi:hypothetical protein